MPQAFCSFYCPMCKVMQITPEIEFGRENRSYKVVCACCGFTAIFSPKEYENYCKANEAVRKAGDESNE